MSAEAEPKAKRTRKPRAKAKRETTGFRSVHVVRGIQYAEDVVGGHVPACKWARLACQRQLDNLKQWRTDDAYPFRFDEDAAARAAEFFEELPHTQGPLAFEREDGSWNTLLLEAWQCFVITTVYGWIRKDSPDHRPTRRFTRVYEEIPRSNGKSLKNSGALLYSFAQGEQGVEAYSAAVDREQAAKVYGEAGAMLTKRPDLAEALGLEQTGHAIIQRATNSRAIALSREAKKSGDGKNIYFAAVDELHAHPTRAVYDVIDTGTGKRGGNALVWIITTAGFDTSGVCYEKRDYITKILEGVVHDETWFGIIYTLDEKDDWRDEACRSSCSDHSHPGCTWRKSNPNFGVSVDPVDFESKVMRAAAVVSEQNGILTKCFNIWCNADVAWMDMAAWDRCGDPELSEDDFDGQPCMLGIDLASKTDIVAKAKLFHRDFEALEDGAPKLDENGTPKLERHFYLFVRSFLPEAAVQQSSNAQLRGWVREGWIVQTDGEVFDDADMERDVLMDVSKHGVSEAAFDPWGARQLANVLQAKGVAMVEVRPTTQNFSEPMKAWHAFVLQGRFHHNANPAMRWMVSNVVCHRDAADNIYPRKLRPENKIDGPVATIMALNRALLAPPEGPSVYETRGIRML